MYYILVSTTTLGSSLGTGGMETKLIAAEISTAAGVTTVITSSKNPPVIFDIIEYDMYQSGKITRNGSSSPPPRRPPYTVFKASPEPMRDLKAWTSHTLNPSGSVIINSTAHHVLSKKESNGQLLAAGVIGVIGVFAAGQAVRIVVRKQLGQEEVEAEKREYLRALETPGTPTSGLPLPISEYHTPEVETTGANGGAPEFTDDDVVEVGRGLANYNSAQILAVKGLNSSFLPQILGYADTEHVVENITIRVPAWHAHSH